jgi:hypothetical protein
MNLHLERVVGLLVGGVGPEWVVPDGALHLGEEGLYLAAVLLGRTRGSCRRKINRWSDR